MPLQTLQLGCPTVLTTPILSARVSLEGNGDSAVRCVLSNYPPAGSPPSPITLLRDETPLTIFLSENAAIETFAAIRKIAQDRGWW
jgi:hypothetical protein